MELTIGILAAMQSELEPFLALGMQSDNYQVLAGRPVISHQVVYPRATGEPLQVNYQLMVCGVGKVRAASATQALIDHCRPDFILNVGTAGALTAEICIGDVVVSLRQHQLDSQLCKRYECESDEEVARFLHHELAKLSPDHVHLGNGCTGDTFQSELSVKQGLAERYRALCVDMESAAIADICAVNQVPFCIVRSISDSFAGKPDEFEQNYRGVSRQIAESLQAVFAPLAQKLADRVGAASSNGDSPLRHLFSGLETPRLRLRRFCANDAEALQRYRGNPVVARFQGWETYSLPQAQALVTEMASFDIDFPGTWFQIAIEQKETRCLIGDISVYTKGDDARQVEIGITLAPEFQGQGMAREAVRAILAHLFSQMEKHRVVATVDVENLACIRLLASLGFRREAHTLCSTWSKGEWRDDLHFALLWEEWDDSCLQE